MVDCGFGSLGLDRQGGERHRAGFLTVGAEYVVLSVDASTREGVRFRIQSDDGLTPALHEAAEFHLVSDAVPPNWRISSVICWTALLMNAVVFAFSLTSGISAQSTMPP